MAQRGLFSEKNKRLALAVLGVLFVVVFVYELFFSGPTARPKSKSQTASGNSNSALPATSSPAPVAQKRPPGAAAEEEARMLALLSDLTPLNTRLVSNGGGKSDPGPRGNIFAFFVPPPPPKTPDPPPPPVQLTMVQPSSLIATTPKNVTVTVSGNKIPADGEIYINGGVRITKRVNDTSLSTEISQGDYATTQNMNIDVKSKSNPEEKSNVLVLVVQPAPEPGFIYKGRLGTLNQADSNFAVFELNSTKEFKRAKVGETVSGVWRIDTITADSVDITHTQLGIKRRLPLQDKVR